MSEIILKYRRSVHFVRYRQANHFRHVTITYDELKILAFSYKEWWHSHQSDSKQ